MTSKQRAKLRSLSNTIDTIFQVGKGGISPELIKQVDDALEARELIKIRTLENTMLSPLEAANELASATESQVVHAIGSRFVLYRKSKKNPKIEL